MQVETALTKAAIIAAVYTATATHPKTIHRNTCQAACSSELAVSSVYKPITTISSISEMHTVRCEHADKLCVASDVPEGCSILQSSYLSAHGYRFLKCHLIPYFLLPPLHLPLTQLPAQIQTVCVQDYQSDEENVSSYKESFALGGKTEATPTFPLGTLI